MLRRHPRSVRPVAIVNGRRFVGDKLSAGRVPVPASGAGLRLALRLFVTLQLSLARHLFPACPVRTTVGGSPDSPERQDGAPLTYPDKDDGVLRQNRRDWSAVSPLGTPAVADQSIHRSRDETVRRALTDATDQRVRSWLADGEDEFAPPGLPIDEWSFFRRGHPHALLIGSAAQASAALARLRRDLRTPLVHWHPSAVADPPQAAGTLIIWEVATLGQTQQERFLMWMDRRVELQVISVARDPVFPLVLEGAFLDTLYYRLNTVCLPLSDSLNVAVGAWSL